jgi:hypothetical protein
MIRALFRRIALLWLRHDLKIIDYAIYDEEKRHTDYPRRMHSWRRERALIQSAIDRRTGRVRIDYSHGPTMKGTK